MLIEMFEMKSLINTTSIQSPCYVLVEELLEKNLQKLHNIQKKSGAKILLALKGFALCESFPLISKYLCGTASSGLWESKLGKEFFQGEVHTYSPAFSDEEIDQVIDNSNNIIFNSFNQLKRFSSRCRGRKVGLRINPEYSEVSLEVYNPCRAGSHLGIIEEVFRREITNDKTLLNQISGLHFHTHCQQNSDALERTIMKFERNFGKYLKDLEWVNFGGGHAMTKDDYDTEKLINIIKHFKNKYNLKVYFELGEAVGLNIGVLVASVLDIIENQMQVAILDVSATNHMPDVIEMSMQPKVYLAGRAKEFRYNYRFGGISCLSGDVIGDYSFDKPINIGDKVIFENMLVYSFVRNNTFNGIKLPSLGVWSKDNSFKLIKEFDYSYYRDKLR